MKKFNLKNISFLKGSKKWIAVFGVIAILFVNVLASLTMNIINLNSDENQNIAESQPEKDKSHLLAGEFIGNGMTLSLASDTVVNTYSADYVTVTATLGADFGGYDEALTWSLAYKFETENTSFNTVNDCIEMFVSVDTHSVTLSSKIAFDAPIILTATSVDNPECTASCQLDYLKRITNPRNIQTNLTAEGENGGHIAFGCANEVVFNYDSSVGTIAPTLNVTSFELELTSDCRGFIKSNIGGDLTVNNVITTDFSLNHVTGFDNQSMNSAIGSFIINLEDLVFGDGDTRQLNNAIYNNAYNQTTGVGGNELTFKATIRVSLTYGGVEYHSYDYTSNYTFKFSRGTLSKINAVTDVTLDKDNIIF